MAKTKPATLSTITSKQLAVIAPTTTPPTKVITVPPGGTLTVIVDVAQMSIPYSVSYAGTNLIKAFVDRAAPVPLAPGEQVLAWAFAHGLKDWHHIIGVSVNGGSPVVLESKSEKNKDQDHSVNFAIIKA